MNFYIAKMKKKANLIHEMNKSLSFFVGLDNIVVLSFYTWRINFISNSRYSEYCYKGTLRIIYLSIVNNHFIECVS